MPISDFSGRIIVIAQGLVSGLFGQEHPGVAYGGEAASVVPGHGPAQIISRTTKDIISDSFAVVGGEFVFPYRVVGVGLLASAPVFDFCDVAPCIVGVGELGHQGAGAAELVAVGAHQIGSRLSGLAVHGELGGLVLQGGFGGSVVGGIFIGVAFYGTVVNGLCCYVSVGIVDGPDGGAVVGAYSQLAPPQRWYSLASLISRRIFLV